MAAVAHARGPPSPPRRAQVRPQVRARMKVKVKMKAQVKAQAQAQVRPQVSRGAGPHLPALPPEIVLRIFMAAVEGEGAVPFLCRVSRVCRLWRDLAADPRLWLRVHLGGSHLGGSHLRRSHLCGPARRRPPEQVLSPLLRLAESRFSLLQEFVLTDWSNHVGAVLQALSKFCPHLRHLELRRCQVEPSALGAFLAAPPPLQRLRLSCPRLRPVLPALAAGPCPGLRLLELEQSPGGPGPPNPLPLERLQAALPLLEVLRLGGALWEPQRCPSPTLPRAAPPPSFPRLRQLALGAGPGAGPGQVGEGLLRRLLRGTPGLRGLQVRGGHQVSPRELLELPCTELEVLSLPVSPGCPSVSPRAGGVAWRHVTRRWHRTLLELDLSGRRDPDLGAALAEFGPRDPLRVLRVAGTAVTARDLSPLLACPQLSLLDVSSCRRLPRGTKRPHRGRGAVLALLRALGAGGDPRGATPEMGTPPNGTSLEMGTSPKVTPPELGTPPEMGTPPNGTSLEMGTPPNL
ncbi:F-box/LRR-repeat protein 6 [Zonotrichia leucophrys gambelii]|uniref:F-box/LRR-repeat protein 6 n=1 Tax=Zonotrichia leucophrys gambelii TaxID=257770 RepID=UPI0031400413